MTKTELNLARKTLSENLQVISKWTNEETAIWLQGFDHGVAHGKVLKLDELSNKIIELNLALKNANEQLKNMRNKDE